MEDREVTAGGCPELARIGRVWEVSDRVKVCTVAAEDAAQAARRAMKADLLDDVDWVREIGKAERLLGVVVCGGGWCLVGRKVAVDP